jgi:hypothetical protein
MRKEALFTYDQRYNDIVQISENVRIERQWKKAELNKISTKLAYEREMEAKLDKELERILGRAVSMADLELLY